MIKKHQQNQHGLMQPDTLVGHKDFKVNSPTLVLALGLLSLSVLTASANYGGHIDSPDTLSVRRKGSLSSGMFGIFDKGVRE